MTLSKVPSNEKGQVKWLLKWLSTMDSLRVLTRNIGTIQRRLAWPLRKDDTRTWLSTMPCCPMPWLACLRNQTTRTGTRARKHRTNLYELKTLLWVRVAWKSFLKATFRIARRDKKATHTCLFQLSESRNPANTMLGEPPGSFFLSALFGTETAAKDLHPESSKSFSQGTCGPPSMETLDNYMVSPRYVCLIVSKLANN